MSDDDPKLPFDPDNAPDFEGSDYDREKDHARLTGQILRVFNLMADGEWRTLGEIQDETGDPEASISAQLRHLRKRKWGASEVQKRRRTEQGLFEYKLIPSRQGLLLRGV